MNEITISPLTYEELKEYCDGRNGSVKTDKDLMFVYEYHLVPLKNEKEENKVFYTFWLATKEDGEVIGEIGFRGKPNEYFEAEIGYFVYEKERGKGYATEMVRQIVDFGLKQNRVKFIVAGVDKLNIASEKVLLKNGFQYWGEKNELNVFYKNA